MNEETKQILTILESLDESKQQEVLIECASRIGTKEWQEDVNDLWQRMLKRDQENSSGK